MEQVPGPVKEERAARASAVAAELHRAYLQGCVGQTYPVLFEQRKDGCAAGHAPNYMPVEVQTQEKQVELADQNYAVVRNRYDNDLALLTDMIDASNMKLSADMALVNARINMLYNYYKLKYLTHTL